MFEKLFKTKVKRPQALYRKNLKVSFDKHCKDFISIFGKASLLRTSEILALLPEHKDHLVQSFYIEGELKGAINAYSQSRDHLDMQKEAINILVGDILSSLEKDHIMAAFSLATNKEKNFLKGDFQFSIRYSLEYNKNSHPILLNIQVSHK